MMKNDTEWLKDEEALIQRIMTEWLCPRDRAEAALPEFRKLSPQLRPAFLEWISSGVVPADLSVAGYSFADIQRLRPRAGVSGAFTWLDGLICKPEETKDLLLNPPRSRITTDEVEARFRRH